MVVEARWDSLQMWRGISVFNMFLPDIGDKSKWRCPRGSRGYELGERGQSGLKEISSCPPKYDDQSMLKYKLPKEA